jgi:hypothetical protein
VKMMQKWLLIAAAALSSFQVGSQWLCPWHHGRLFYLGCWLRRGRIPNAVQWHHRCYQKYRTRFCTKHKALETEWLSLI